MSHTTAIVLIAAVAYVMSISFRMHKAPHTPHFFTTGLKGTPDVPEAPPVPALY